jgi:hypothetical protein
VRGRERDELGELLGQLVVALGKRGGIERLRLRVEHRLDGGRDGSEARRRRAQQTMTTSNGGNEIVDKRLRSLNIELFRRRRGRR